VIVTMTRSSNRPIFFSHPAGGWPERLERQKARKMGVATSKRGNKQGNKTTISNKKFNVFNDLTPSFNRSTRNHSAGRGQTRQGFQLCAAAAMVQGQRGDG
jgi:hypothetical protein